MSDALTVAVFVAGLVLVAVGAGMVFLPAGLIVAGVELAAVAVGYARSPGDGGSS